MADGTIYLYFKNKDDILVQFFSYKTKQVFERFRIEVSRGGNSIEKLRNLVRLHLSEMQPSSIRPKPTGSAAVRNLK